MPDAPLDLEPYRRRSAQIRATLEAKDFYDDPKATIPDDYDALIAEVERLRDRGLGIDHGEV